MDVARRYLDVFEALRRGKRWNTDVTVLRLAALTLMAADVRDPWRELHAAAETLRARSSWSGPLRSALRYSVAAMILRRRLDPARVHDRVGDTLASFKTHGLRRSSTQSMLAALLLVLHHDGGTVPSSDVERMAAVLDAWKRDHPWLTGMDDYPMAALHATRDGGIAEGAARVESIYRALRERKYGRGNALQLAAHLCSLRPGAPATVAARFDRIRRALVERGLRCGRSRWDEIAILGLTGSRPAELARRVAADVRTLRAAKPRPTADLAFSLAAGIALAREIPDKAEIGDLVAVSAARAALEAQQAAVIAAIAASTAATTAAASS